MNKNIYDILYEILQKIDSQNGPAKCFLLLVLVFVAGIGFGISLAFFTAYHIIMSIIKFWFQKGNTP